MITGLYPHHHGYLHWDATLDPAMPTLFTVAAANGYATGSFVFDENFLFKGFADANVAGTSETLDGVVELAARAPRSEPFVLWFHSWATHMPYDVLHAERKEWLAAKETIIAGIQSGDAARARGAPRGVRAGRRALLRDLPRRLPRGSSTRSGCARTRRSRSRPTTASRGASGSPTSTR